MIGTQIYLSIYFLYEIKVIKSFAGCFIKRQKIPLPGCDRNVGPYYKLTDLVVGETVTFYQKELKITGVDDYTRDFLYKMGVSVLENEPIPDDPYSAYRKEVNIQRVLFIYI